MFWAAVLSEVGIITIYNMKIVSFLWLNVIGAVLVVLVAGIFQFFMPKSASSLQE